eukprot:gene15307-biopygen20171
MAPCSVMFLAWQAGLCDQKILQPLFHSTFLAAGAAGAAPAAAGGAEAAAAPSDTDSESDAGLDLPKADSSEEDYVLFLGTPHASH